MAYTAPRTWVTGELVTAALLNTHLKDNLNAAFPLGVDAWTAYTPTLTQSATVTKTTTYAKYQRVGRLIVAQIYLTCTGAGTAANPVLIGLPVAAAATAFTVVGQGYIYDQSANLVYRGIADLVTTTSVRLLGTNSTASAGLGQDTFTAALASPDEVKVSVMYEAVT